MEGKLRGDIVLKLTRVMLENWLYHPFIFRVLILICSILFIIIFLGCYYFSISIFEYLMHCSHNPSSFQFINGYCKIAQQTHPNCWYGMEWHISKWILQLGDNGWFCELSELTCVPPKLMRWHPNTQWEANIF